MENLEIIYKDVDELIPYINNSRTHDELQISQIAASIREFGFLNPILIRPDNTVDAGHARLAAAKKLGLERVPCIYVHHLTEAQHRAFNIADNRIQLNAGWDAELLSIELKDLEKSEIDLELLGFEDKEINALLDPSPKDDKDKSEDDELPEIVIYACGKCGAKFEKADLAKMQV